MKESVLMTMIFVMVGLIFLLLAVTLHWWTANMKRRATAQATAKVVGKYRRQGNTWYSYEFYAEGAVRTVRRGGAGVPVGESVELLYIPGDPERVYIPSSKPWFAVVLLYCVGVLAPLLGLLIPALDGGAASAPAQGGQEAAGALGGSLILFIIAVFAVCMVGSALLLFFFFRHKEKQSRARSGES